MAASIAWTSRPAGAPRGALWLVHSAPARVERLRTALTVAGIALGVAVVLAIRLANASALGGFSAALDTVAGRTSLEVIGTGLGVDEARLASLGWLRQWGEVSPVIEGDAVAVLGRTRARRCGFSAWTSFAISRFVSTGCSTSARKSGSRRPRRFSICSSTRHPSSSPRCLPAGTGWWSRRQAARIPAAVECPPGYWRSDRAVPDPGAAQERRPGTRARRQLRPDGHRRCAARVRSAWPRGSRRRSACRSVAPRRGRAAIGSRLPPGLGVQRPARRGQQVEQMLAAFQFNLAALSYVALLVGLFLVYNTVATSVIARRDEIGMLRAVGASRRQLFGLFLGEAAALAVAGCAIGIPLGWALARAAVAFTSSTVTTLYVAHAAGVPALSLTDAAAAVGDRAAALAARGVCTGARSLTRQPSPSRPGDVTRWTAAEAPGTGPLRERRACSPPRAAHRPGQSAGCPCSACWQPSWSSSALPRWCRWSDRRRESHAGCGGSMARRGRTPRARESHRRDSQARHLRRGAGREPRDAGGHRHHDRQFPRDGDLLGLADPARRPVRRHRTGGRISTPRPPSRRRWSRPSSPTRMSPASTASAR